MKFEWDELKSTVNLKKHGVTFAQATEVWKGVHLTVSDIAKSSDGEKRSATIGFIGNHIYTAIWTRRKGRIRLISVRRSRDGEKEVFKKKTL